MARLKVEDRRLLKVLLVMLLWGSLFPMVKLGFQAYQVETTGQILVFAGIRFTICGALICFYSLACRREALASVKGALTLVLWSGFFSIVLHYGFTYMGLNLTASSKTAILKQIGVLFYVCFSSLFFRDDRLTSKKLLGVLLGFVGVITINSGINGVRFEIGDCMIIAASFCTVFSNVISKKAFVHVEPVAATGISQMFGGTILLAMGLGMKGYVVINHSLWIIVYICVASVISYCLWFNTLKDGELSKLFIMKFAEPVFAAVFGAVLLGENIFRVQYLVAFVLIAAGIFIANHK